MGMTRITVRQPGKKRKQTFVLMNDVIPDIGDLCTIKGVDYEVTKIEKDHKPAAVFSTAGGKLKQVFP